nr:TAXI family TRAP transporter solute-binding subunit [uncultured Oscillibacter sp.]
MKKLLALLLALLLTASLAACGGNGGKTQEDPPAAPAGPTEPSGGGSADEGGELNIDVKDIIFQSGSTGGNWAIVQPAMVTAIENALPGVTVTGITGSGAANLRAIQAGECDMAFTQGHAYEDALHGVNDFEADGAMDNVAVICSTNVSYMYFVAAARAGIKSIEDIANSNLNCNTAGGGVEIFTRRVLESYGITYDDIQANGHTLNYQGLSDVIELMQDGHVDVSVVSGMLDNPTTHQMESSFDIDVLSFEGEAAQKFVKDYPSFSLATMPAGIYKGQDEEKAVMAWTGLMCCRRDLSDDVVYAITKALHENADDFAAVVPENAWIGTPDCLTGFEHSNLHPGALRYYQEIGLL